MQSAVPVGAGAMSAVLGLDEDTVSKVCAGISKADYVVEPANFNCPGQVVIAGSADAVAAADVELKTAGAKRVVPLPVSAPFHCSLMQPAKEAMAVLIFLIKPVNTEPAPTSINEVTPAAIIFSTDCVHLTVPATGLAENGAAVAVNYSSSESSALEVAEIIRKNGGKAEIFKARVNEEAEVEEMFSALHYKYIPPFKCSV